MVAAKILGACLLFPLLVVGVAADNGRSLLTADTSCRAFAFLSIEIVGFGKCRGTARANCTNLDESRISKREIFEDLFENGVCSKVHQKIASVKLADSVGGVWADAIAHVSCTGKGYGCGWVMADPAGWGASFGQMFVEAAKEALGEEAVPELNGFCPEDMNGAKSSLADSANVARAFVCETGESTTEEYKQEYTKISSTAILKAIRVAASAVCGKQSKKSWCNPKRKEPKTLMCSESTVKRCCNPRTASRGICVCSKCNNPLRRTAGTGSKIVWTDSSDVKCECPPVPRLGFQ